MPHEPTSRRSFLTATSGAFAALWLAGDTAQVRASLEHAARAARAGAPPPWEVLTPEQAADVEAIAAQIYPADDTPGAKEARVVNFIDHSMATWGASQREPLMKGLDQLNAKAAKRWPGSGRFAALSADRQIELLRAEEKTEFFNDIRDATLMGMFALPSYGGNADKTGWAQIGFEDRPAWQPPFGHYDAEASKGGE